MLKLTYTAFLERARHGYGAFFPNVPGCTSGGDDLDSVRRNVAEALQFHIDGMRASGEPIVRPARSSAWPRWAGVRGRNIIRMRVSARIRRISKPF
jgi:predicted RNase H-like HicB family nuclease